MFDNTNTADQTAVGTDPQAAMPVSTPPSYGPPPDPATTTPAVTPEMSTLNAMAGTTPTVDSSAAIPTELPATAPDVPTAVADPTMSSNYVDAIASPAPVTPDMAASQSVATNPPATAFDAGTSTNMPVAPPPLTEDASNSLSEIKQDALQQLSPLVDHLDQTPEEKFRTTMMMLQATDNHELVKTAYEAAQAISDERARARALLDVVNEINYFHQQEKQQ